MKSKAFIQQAMKNWDSNDAYDSVQKNRLQIILKKHFKLSCLFDSTIFISKDTYTVSDVQPEGTKEEILKNYHIFKPDIIIKNPPIIIEFDGEYHYTTKKGVARTILRNKVYNSTNVIFISFYTKSFNEMDDYTLLEELKKQLGDKNER